MNKFVTTVVAGTVAGVVATMVHRPSKKSKQQVNKTEPKDRNYDRSEVSRKGDDFHFFV